MTMKFEDLTSIEAEHGVTEAGKPFVKLRAIGRSRILLGQVDPETAVALAMNMLTVASRADYEGDLLTTMNASGLDEDAKGVILTMVREGEHRRMSGGG